MRKDTHQLTINLTGLENVTIGESNDQNQIIQDEDGLHENMFSPNNIDGQIEQRLYSDEEIKEEAKNFREIAPCKFESQQFSQPTSPISVYSSNVKNGEQSNYSSAYLNQKTSNTNNAQHQVHEKIKNNYSYNIQSKNSY